MIGTPRIPRWGIPDAFVVQWFSILVIVLGLLAVLAGADTSDSGNPNVTAIVVVVVLQYGTALGTAAIVSRRKGLGTLGADFGLTLRVQDWTWWLRGLGLQLAISVALAPFVLLSDERQTVVEDLRDSGGARLVAYIVAAVIVAPVVEELVFRGVLLRSLVRRVSPEAALAISSLVFAVAHPLADPSVGSLAVVPGLVVFGLVSGTAALRSGNLSRSILLHVGFNSMAVLVALSG